MPAAARAAVEDIDTRAPLLGLGSGDVLTVTSAARALHMREADARAWLRDEDLIRTVAGRERVLWGDVLAAIRRGDTPKCQQTGDKRRGGSLPRARL
jgi:hypothetical protein